MAKGGVLHTVPMDRKWNIHEMLLRGKGVVSTFVAGRDCSKKAAAKFDRTLDHLQQVDKPSWERPYASSLGDNIYVIRFTDENRRQLRVFGHFEDVEHCFVMTLTGGEKGNTYDPANYDDQASKFRNVVASDFFGNTASYDERCDNHSCGKELSGIRNIPNR